MSKLIGAEAAKLAGLLVDFLQKMRDGQATLNHFEWFNNLTQGERDQLVASGKTIFAPAPSVVSAKFSLFVDLGTIIVPQSYVHKTRLMSFEEENRKKFYSYNDNVSDANFSHSSRAMNPGDKLWVRVFKQIVPGTTTSEERLAFLKTQNAVFVGAQGLTLVWEQKKDQLPRGYWYCSFDEKRNLWRDAGGSHRVPSLYHHSDGDWDFSLGDFEGVWHDADCLLCFCDCA